MVENTRFCVFFGISLRINRKCGAAGTPFDERNVEQLCVGTRLALAACTGGEILVQVDQVAAGRLLIAGFLVIKPPFSGLNLEQRDDCKWS